MCRLLPQLPYTKLVDPLKNRLGSVEPFSPNISICQVNFNLMTENPRVSFFLNNWHIRKALSNATTFI